MSIVVTQVRVEAPKPFATIKHKTQEHLFVRIGVQVSGEVDPTTLIAEVWAALKDDQNKRHDAYDLTYHESIDGWHYFQGSLKLPYTGYFPLRFRARHHNR